MLRHRLLRLTLIVVIFLIPLWFYLPTIKNYLSTNKLDFTNSNNNSGFTDAIVPNIIHFFKFKNHNFTFTDMICLLAAWCNQQPEQIIIHCDCVDFNGPYWDKVKNLKNISIHPMNEPRAVFGRPLSSSYHAGDVARLVVLSRYGGIALDFDSYLVQSVDEFRHFEFSIGWAIGKSLGCQVMIAHKDARFLQMWIDSYKFYRPQRWYYNAGELPTKILEKYPHLVHRVPEKFGVDIDMSFLYKSNWSKWKDFYAIHLLVRHRYYLDSESRITEFDNENIRTYPYTFGAMARLVLFGTEDVVNSTAKWNFDQCRV